MVQLPLPKHINEEKVLSFIPPQKDVDGMSPYNIGSLALKNHSPFFISCTPLACQELILSSISEKHNVLMKMKSKKPLSGKKVCIIGRSNIVGMPLSLLLQQRHNASVKICHTKTSQLDLE
jgi:5,10-methylene-tetrahydrofolate dehydrogenase/methenyl tetrahydrofolate cyclohydrolase